MRRLLPDAVTNTSILLDHVFDEHDFQAFHGGLECVDGVDLGDEHAATLPTQRLHAALADVAVTEHEGGLAAEHDVGGTADRVDQRVATAVQVVELRLGDRIVDVDRWEEQFTVGEHLVEALHAGGGLFGDAFDFASHTGPLLAVGLQ